MRGGKDQKSTKRPRLTLYTEDQEENPYQRERVTHVVAGAPGTPLDSDFRPCTPYPEPEAQPLWLVSSSWPWSEQPEERKRLLQTFASMLTKVGKRKSNLLLKEDYLRPLNEEKILIADSTTGPVLLEVLNTTTKVMADWDPVWSSLKWEYRYPSFYGSAVKKHQDLDIFAFEKPHIVIPDQDFSVILAQSLGINAKQLTQHKISQERTVFVTDHHIPVSKATRVLTDGVPWRGWHWLPKRVSVVEFPTGDRLIEHPAARLPSVHLDVTTQTAPQEPKNSDTKNSSATKPAKKHPSQCFKCQRFGHSSQQCEAQEDVCRRCAGPHRAADCTAQQPRCANCAGKHPASSLSCPARPHHKRKATVPRQSRPTLPQENLAQLLLTILSSVLDPPNFRKINKVKNRRAKAK